jgi:hypothetical protein
VVSLHNSIRLRTLAEMLADGFRMIAGAAVMQEEDALAQAL